MKKQFVYRIVAVLMALMLAVGSMSGMVFAESSETVTAESQTALQFRDLTAEQITAEMGLGWNLGNTMDGHTGLYPSETLWQNVETSRLLMDSLHDMGFNTVRVPVTWGKKIVENEDGTFSIDEKWLGRVQDIVDYCVAQDMYVIINIHHDGAEQSGWLRIAAEGEDLDEVKTKFAGVWEAIATRFRDYDEHLIFESMNEVVGTDDGEEGIKKDIGVIMELNQIFVDTVRLTGSNNARRWLSVPGRYTNIVNTTKTEFGFAMPEDKYNDQPRLMLSVHDYDWTFGMVENLNDTEYTEGNALALAYNFQKLADQFTSKGYPVVLGEYGAINKNNTANRAYYYEAVVKMSQVTGVVPCLWDQGWYDLEADPDYSYTLVDRKTGEAIYKDIVDAIMRGWYVRSETDSTKDLSSIENGQDPSQLVTVRPISSIEIENTALTLEAGSSYTVAPTVAPADTNDVVLYKTSDPSVATVYNGYIRARSIGSATITVFSQSGSVEETIEVTVIPNSKLENPVKSFRIKESSYLVIVGGSDTIEVATSPMTTDDQLTYRSSDESVVTVNQLGKLVGIKEGRALITITSQSGAVNYVPVVVSKTAAKVEATIALYVYYNDGEKEYFGNDEGESVTITGDGTYTLNFDCAAHLSTEARGAGVNSLTNVGAIYIKDVTASSKTFKSANIFYEEIIVDGTPLTVNMTEPKSALKSSGIFDTNEPINAWDGSFVDEVAVEEFVLNFTTLTNPTTISVKFTLSDVAFTEGEAASTEGMIRMESVAGDGDAVVTDAVTALNVTATPSDTTECVTFISTDSSVIWVDSDRVAVDPATGTATANVVAVGPGTAAIIAYSDMGTMCTVNVTSEYTSAEAVGTAVELFDLSTVSLPVIVEPEEVEEPVEDTQPTEDTEEPAESKNEVQLSPTAVVAIIAASLVVLTAVVCSIIMVSSAKASKKRAAEKIAAAETASDEETTSSEENTAE